jgi:hypothetical protein
MASGNGRPSLAKLDRRITEVEAGADRKLTETAQGFMTMMASMALDRPEIARSLGLSYNTLRDLYKSLGWSRTLTHERDYYPRYRRDPVAKAVIDAPVRACWRPNPTIKDAGEDDTEFEKQIDELFKKRRAFHYMSRVQRLASLGEYAVMLMGFNDRAAGVTLEGPLGKAKDLLYLQVYSEENADIKTLQTDPQKERYGLPEIYEIRMRNIGEGSLTGQTTKVPVHHSRVVHVADDLLESDTHGTPGLEAIFNMLVSLELVAGCSSEFFYRGAFMGLAAIAHEGAKFGPQSGEALKEEMQKYQMDLQRILTIKGADLMQLKPLMASPKEYVEVYKDLIAAAKRFPKRILFGSERGELASNQDKMEWGERIGEIREEHCEPVILTPVVDAVIETGVVTAPGEDGWEAEWKPVHTPTDKELAERATTIATGLKQWIESGGEEFIALRIMMEEWGFTKEQMQRNETIIEEEREAFEAKQREAQAQAAAEAERAAAAAAAAGAQPRGSTPPQGSPPSRGPRQPAV